VNSIHRAAPGSPLVSAENSATNLAGETKVIPPWENQDNRFDVSGNGSFAPIDALQVINELIDQGIHDLPAPTAGNQPPPFLDVSGDNSVSPVDALQVINELIDAQPMIAAQPQHSLDAAKTFAAPEPTALTLLVSGSACLLAAAGPLGRNRARLFTRRALAK
jgi:hypothetical protein